MPRILVAEDEAPLRRLYEHILKRVSLDVSTVKDGDEALRVLHEFRPDLLITDLRMPGTDGWTLMEQVRKSEKFGKTPILVVSAVEEELTSYRSLLCGGDDFILKPIRPFELIERIQGMLKRRSFQDHHRFPPSLRLGPFAFESASMQATFEGCPLDLTKNEFMALALLMLEHPHTASLEAILERALGYPPGAGDAKTVRATIIRLREKLGDDTEEPRLVLTEIGKGYRLNIAKDTYNA